MKRNLVTTITVIVFWSAARSGREATQSERVAPAAKSDSLLPTLRAAGVDSQKQPLTVVVLPRLAPRIHEFRRQLRPQSPDSHPPLLPPDTDGNPACHAGRDRSLRRRLNKRQLIVVTYLFRRVTGHAGWSRNKPVGRAAHRHGRTRSHHQVRYNYLVIKLLLMMDAGPGGTPPLRAEKHRTASNDTAMWRPSIQPPGARR